jgi:hypothetical protein
MRSSESSTTLGEALDRRSVRLDGERALVRAFDHWFAGNPMADAVRAAIARRLPVAPGDPKQAVLMSAS